MVYENYLNLFANLKTKIQANNFRYKSFNYFF